jgi:hypothetical protein
VTRNVEDRATLIRELTATYRLMLQRPPGTYTQEAQATEGTPEYDLAQRIEWLLDGWPSDEAQTAMAEAQAAAAESRTNLSPRSSE